MTMFRILQGPFISILFTYFTHIQSDYCIYNGIPYRRFIANEEPIKTLLHLQLGEHINKWCNHTR